MNVPELKIPPLALVVVFAGAMWLAAAKVPVLALDLPPHQWIAVLAASLGIGLVLVAGLGFRRAGTTVNPTQARAPWNHASA